MSVPSSGTLSYTTSHHTAPHITRHHSSHAAVPLITRRCITHHTPLYHPSHAAVSLITCRCITHHTLLITRRCITRHTPLYHPSHAAVPHITRRCTTHHTSSHPTRRGITHDTQLYHQSHAAVSHITHRCITRHASSVVIPSSFRRHRRHLTLCPVSAGWSRTRSARFLPVPSAPTDASSGCKQRSQRTHTAPRLLGTCAQLALAAPSLPQSAPRWYRAVLQRVGLQHRDTLVASYRGIAPTPADTAGPSDQPAGRPLPANSLPPPDGSCVGPDVR